MEYELKEPIHFGEQVITKLVFKPLKAKHVRGTDQKVGVDQLLTLASKVTGVTSEMLDEMGMEDMTEVIKIVGGFLNPGRSTGESTTRPSP